MVKSIESVNAITEETTASTEQMAAGNYEVQQSMDQINEITQESGEAIDEELAA
jgi:methyl-accepting chemotaxis protein